MEECESALDRADRVIDIQADTISQLDAQNHRLQLQLDLALAEQARAEAWYRQPSLIAPVTFVLGVALGAYVVNGASR